MRMHPHQLEVSESDARRLLAAQFPRWADEPIVRVPSHGTTNAMFRVGEDKVARLPFIPGDGVDVAGEARILERLRGALPVAIPAVLALGQPDEGYPYRWAVLSWIPGGTPLPERLRDANGLADDLVGFLHALQALPAGNASLAQRGGRLHGLDAEVRAAIGQLAGEFDAEALSALWSDALTAPPWDGPAVWLHADLLPSNLLVDGSGRLHGVIDWAAAGVGDPACELLAAWNVLPASTRKRFREGLADEGLDDDAWRRGRGWAVAQAALALPYYRETNPGMVEMAHRALSALQSEPVR